MPRFAANLSMMYQEHAFLDRFAAAAADGFDAVEYLFPYDFEPADIAARLQAHGLTQALFNLPPGDFAKGERGIAIRPGREAEFAAGVQRALVYAQATGCTRLHVMAGLVQPGDDLALLRQTYITNLRVAAQAVAPQGITLVIEPINTRDIPGYFLNFQQQAHDIVAEVGAANLKVQMDFYHCQIMEGDLLERWQRHQAGVGHVQIAGVPERHEPDEHNEVNYSALFAALDASRYDGFVGCEYRPRAGTSAGLGWLKTWKAGDAGHTAFPGAPAPGLYRHTDGGYYRVTGMARDSRDTEPLVLYEHVWPFEAGAWTRPLHEWASRFTPVAAAELAQVQQGDRAALQAHIRAARAARKGQASA